MVEVQPVAVFLGAELPSHPFAGLKPEFGPLHMLAVQLPSDILTVVALALHPVIRSVVSNFEHFIKERVGLGFPCARVFLREGCVLRQPLKHRRLCWRVGFFAD